MSGAGSGGDESRQPDTSDLGVESVNVQDLSKEAQDKAIKGEMVYSLAGLCVGGIVIVGGIVLAALGYSGAVDITFQSGDAKGHLVTGSLGIVIALIGAAIVWMTRYSVTSTTAKRPK